ncbi:MAG: GFA family protein [Pseudomonadota bacterium]
MAVITGRCYCGAVALEAADGPQVVTYCHCQDCRRSAGAPVAAFAAFAEEAVSVDGPLRAAPPAGPGAKRMFCAECGTPILARYDYLVGQVYVSLGCLDQAAELAPSRHAHHDAKLPWLDLADDLPRDAASARDALRRG